MKTQIYAAPAVKGLSRKWKQDCFLMCHLKYIYTLSRWEWSDLSAHMSGEKITASFESSFSPQSCTRDLGCTGPTLLDKLNLIHSGLFAVQMQTAVTAAFFK